MFKTEINNNGNFAPVVKLVSIKIRIKLIG